MGELKKRIITAVLLAPVIVSVFYFLSEKLFLIFLVLVSTGAALEASFMVRLKRGYIIPFFMVLGFLSLYYREAQLFLLSMMLPPFIYLSLELIRPGGKKGDVIQEVFAVIVCTMFSQLFIALPLFHFFLLKGVNRSLPLTLLFAIWLSDICAYFSGKFFGRRLLVPHISPKKTYEGLLGAVFGSMVVFFTTRGISGFGLGESLFIGLMVGIFGQIGDIFESLCKRIAGVKDSSSLIPGHGGILDRMDSFIFTAPLLYYSTLLKA
ncbi:MAG: phosphatidate cytidylyltransferase [Syntrophorhabdaceae bacterium]|nr:phosphatidate cytidylyltransferase [Syntrophorhabdaceae bacterium]